jgi:hypothetical protein
MHESIYHIHANYCGERRLFLAGYASRVSRRLGMSQSQLAAFDGEEISIHIAPTTDRFGNRVPYQLWSAPATITSIHSSTHGA